MRSTSHAQALRSKFEDWSFLGELRVIILKGSTRCIAAVIFAITSAEFPDPVRMSAISDFRSIEYSLPLHCLPPDSLKLKIFNDDKC